MKFLKNYTSEVPVSQTVHRIEQVLIRCGVSGISKEYAPGSVGIVAAVIFQIETPQSGNVSIRLPVNVNAAHDALWLNYADGDKLTPDGTQLQWSSHKKKTKADFREQAERTAWKIIQDWVEVQLSMIQMKQAEAMEIFLPYIYDGNRTGYQLLKAGGFRGLLPEKTSDEKAS